MLNDTGVVVGLYGAFKNHFHEFLGDVLLTTAGNCIVDYIARYLKKTNVDMSFSRRTTAVQIIAARIADRANNFTLVIDCETDKVSLKHPLALPNAPTSTTTNSNSQDSLTVGPMTPMVHDRGDRRSWEDWERKALMKCHETIMAKPKARNIWMEIAKLMLQDWEISVTNDQCRTQACGIHILSNAFCILIVLNMHS